MSECVWLFMIILSPDSPADSLTSVTGKRSNRITTQSICELIVGIFVLTAFYFLGLIRGNKIITAGLYWMLTSHYLLFQALSMSYLI